MAVNIDIDQNEDVEIVIADATVQATDKIIASFNQDKVNIFNRATVNCGGASGEVVIDPGVDITIHLTTEQALLLNATDPIEYTVHKLLDDDVPELLQDGTGDLIPLEGTAEEDAPIPYYNSNNVRPDGDAPPITEDTDITQLDDTIIFTPAEAATITGSLLEAGRLIGKEYTLYNNGDGIVNIEDDADNVLFVLNAKGDSINIVSTAIGWIKI